MNLKSNFKQAAQELWKGPKGLSNRENKAEDKPDPDLNSQKDISSPETALPVVKREQAEKRFIPKNSFAAEITTIPAQRTIIAPGDIVSGNLQCTGDIEIYGTVNGDITGKGNLAISGKQEGNASCCDITINKGEIKGDIIASGNMKVDGGSCIVGNITAGSMVFDGKIPGDLDIKSSLILNKNAVISGKIIAGSISVEDGANICGEIQIRSINPTVFSAD